jgi:hypothetical protein
VLAVAAELWVADVDATEVRARLGVIGPDLLLVLERRLTSVRVDDDGRLPAVRIEDARRRRIVESRDTHAKEAVELGVRKREPGWPGSDQVGVVHPRSVAPRERPVLVDGADCQSGITR